MPEPIEYLIVRNLQAALAAISVATGSHYTVAESAVKLDPNQEVEALVAVDGPRPFVVLEVTPDEWKYLPARQLRKVMPVTIHWVSESVPATDESLLQTYLRGCADVERAIALDITRGGHATDTRVVKQTFDRDVDSSQVWAMVDVQIAYFRTYGQPDA